MASYHIYVRDYHWSHHNLVVQSPILKLSSPPTTLIIRQLEGTNREEPRVVGSIADLKDDIHGEVYRTEAHGLFVPTDGRQTAPAPVWVLVQNDGCKENEVHVVNLATFKTTNAPISQICWIPGREGPDQSLYTVIGAPRKLLGATAVLALVQRMWNPAETKFILLDPSKLASYEEISDVRKKSLFEIQLRTVQAKTKPPSGFLRDAYRLFSSPYRHGYGRRTLDEIFDEDLEVPRLSSDCSSQDSISDDDMLNDKPVYESLVAAPNRFYDCDCKHAGLGPTHVNPRPSHRHGKDQECSLGSAHKHCIFTDRRPGDCVISRLREPHQHCIDPLEAIQSEFERDHGKDYCANADALYEEAGRSSQTLDFMDFEPSLVDSPPTFARYSTPGPMTPFQLPDAHLASGMHYGPTLYPHTDFEICLSPEPPDLQF
ncbi:hypothetical protein F4818DRAFT_444115 [Hypoxylon cercidicola]|nr:hypothetical protein F4818DRAFT_444115 [Hypoxylon cercidicola]